MEGLVAPTDFGWYSFLLEARGVEEVNFWRPSAHHAVRARPFTPFLFKLKAPHNSICGYGFFAKYSALPIWLAWETFGIGNGCPNKETLYNAISKMRSKFGAKGTAPKDSIGCVLLVSPVFFPRAAWIPQPEDWPAPNLVAKRYDLTHGEGKRVWDACLERTGEQFEASGMQAHPELVESPSGYGAPRLIQPRLGQGTFRISVTDAYARACAVTGEHSLPALEAAHIRPFSESGPHEIRNGLLLRADFHRLFDQGYLTVTPQLHLEVSSKLREDFENGRSYYPFHGKKLQVPQAPSDLPARGFVEWHNENVYRG